MIKGKIAGECQKDSNKWGIGLKTTVLANKLDFQSSAEMFYLNTIEQLFLFVEQLDQLEVCLPDSRLLTGIPIQDTNTVSIAIFKVEFK